MILYPNAKINLGLNILRKRPDGFHDIRTLFYPVPWCDVLEVEPTDDGQISFTVSGLEIPGMPGSNLCIKAWELLMDQGYPIPGARIRLEKRIPAGSGLGGGSSDGAFTLRMLNDMFSLRLGREQLASLAAHLGSDCPFFIYNTPMLASGRGEVLSPALPDLTGLQIAVVVPPVHISTAHAYSGVIPKLPRIPVSEAIRRPVREWKETLVNDFEEALSGEFPVIRETMETLYELGAEYASLSGSGSAVYGIFRAPVNLSDHFPGWAAFLTSKLP